LKAETCSNVLIVTLVQTEVVPQQLLTDAFFAAAGRFERFCAMPFVVESCQTTACWSCKAGASQLAYFRQGLSGMKGSGTLPVA